MLDALVGAYGLIQHARRVGAFTYLGGDVYIDEGAVTEALCRAFNLDIMSAKRDELEQKILEHKAAKVGARR